MQPELNSELEKVHVQIARMLGLDMKLLTFNYTTNDGKTTLQLATMNPRHQQVFLFHTTTGFGEIDALNKMQEYVEEKNGIGYKTFKGIPNSRSTYTIQWAITDSNDLQTSYFAGKNLYEVLDKFYYGANSFKTIGAPGKAVTETIIFNITLNPLS